MALQAKLVNGETYVLSRENMTTPSKRFMKGEWTTITADEQIHMKKNALQRVTIKRGKEIEASWIQMFEYREGVESTEKGETEAPAVRQRARG